MNLLLILLRNPHYFRGLFVRRPFGQLVGFGTDRENAMKRCGTPAIFVVVVSVGHSAYPSGNE